MLVLNQTGPDEKERRRKNLMLAIPEKSKVGFFPKGSVLLFELFQMKRRLARKEEMAGKSEGEGLQWLKVETSEKRR